jgi:hypothetical protein
MVNYQDGRIYTIRCRTDNTLIYVGSTTQSLARRWAEHKSDSIKEKHQNRLIYKTINGNWKDWYYELYELYPCNSKEELCRREGEITREIGTLNMTIAGRTLKEWGKENPDKVKLIDKKYYENNKQKVLEQQKVYYTNNLEKIQEQTKLYRENNKDKKREQDKLYYTNNLEKIQEQTKLYRENNKDKLNEKSRERWKQYITCECGCISTKYGLSKHLKTKKHIEALNPV